MTVFEFVTLNIGAILLILAGIVLVGLEMFLPGFGVPGIAGGACLVVGIVLASGGSWARGLLLALLSLAVLCLMLVISVRSARKGRLSRGALILGASTSAEAGFDSVPDESALLHAMGRTQTVLRPSGIAEIAGRKMDVVTEAEFLPAGTPVRVVQVEGRRIVVRSLTEDQMLEEEAAKTNSSPEQQEE